MSIKIKNLYKNYKGFEAVKNLNFKLKKVQLLDYLDQMGVEKLLQ